MINLPEMFARIDVAPRSLSEGQFAALELSGFRKYRLAKDYLGRPALLIEVSDQHGEVGLVPLRFRHLIVEHGARCRIFVPGGEEKLLRCSIVQCTSEDNLLQEYFLAVCDALVDVLGADADPSVLQARLEGIAGILEAISAPLAQTVRATWGELFVIAQCSDPNRALSAWHVQHGDTFDFSRGRERVDVKVYSSGSRNHYVSYDQVNPPKGVRAFLCSVLVPRSAGGLSVFDLMERVEHRHILTPENRFKLQGTVAELAGGGLATWEQERFDEHRARESLAFIDSELVPKIAPPLPEGVSAVRHKSNIEACNVLVDPGESELVKILWPR